MDEVQKIIESIDPSKQRPSVKAKLKSWKESSFDWAYDYVYGVEADYRLVKTAKVSCFLNGDGLANVIHADGLDHFQKSIDYKGKLKEVSADETKDNGQFDILVANPPYSVSAFKNTLKNGEESFDLFNRITDNSSEIECLFIERSKQLLKPKGFAGLVLPATILNNPGIYQDAREILLKFFRIKAITKFGNNTFMATGTPTIAIFLERRENNEWKKIDVSIENFFKSKKDGVVTDSKSKFSDFVTYVYGNISFSDYLTLVNHNPNEAVKQEELFIDYNNWFSELSEIKKVIDSQAKEIVELRKTITKRITDKNKENKKPKSAKDLTELIETTFKKESDILSNNHKTTLDKLFYSKLFEIEKKRMLYFFLTANTEIVLVDVGEKKDEKEFIGYEFSERRGHEGIHMYRDSSGVLTTKLYNEGGLIDEKANFYINNLFNGKSRKINSILSNNLSYVELQSIMHFNQLDITNSINLTPAINPFEDSELTLVRAKELFVLEYGKPLAENQRVKGDYPVMGSNGITGYHNQFLIKGPSIIVGRKGSAGKLTYVETNSYPIDTTFYVVNKSDYPLKYIYYLLLVLPLKALSKSMGVPGLNRNEVHGLKVPLVDKKLIKKKIEYLDKLFENRNKTFDHKLKATENEEIFAEKFSLEIINTFKL